jgi:hypothetical protein
MAARPLCPTRRLAQAPSHRGRRGPALPCPLSCRAGTRGHTGQRPARWPRPPWLVHEASPPGRSPAESRGSRGAPRRPARSWRRPTTSSRVSASSSSWQPSLPSPWPGLRRWAAAPPHPRRPRLAAGRRRRRRRMRGRGTSGGEWIEKREEGGERGDRGERITSGPH